MTQRFSPATPVFALHASASGPSQWRRLAMDLADRNAVIAIDLKDRFLKDNAGWIAGLKTAAQFVIHEIEEAGGAVHLVGHSFGGAVALKVALMRSDLIASLTLYEPVAFFLADEDNREDAVGINTVRAMAESLEANTAAGRPDLAIRQFIAYWNGKDRWDHMPESTQQRLTDTASSVLADFYAVFGETATLEDFSTLSIPTLILSGMESPTIAQRIGARLASVIPDARLAILPALGHMAPLTDPDWVNPRICQHIAERERNATRVRWPNTKAA